MKKAIHDRRARKRQAALEWLEPRALLAVLPSPTVSDPVLVSTATSNTSNESSPSIAIDQSNPNHLVAVWTRFDTQPNPDLYTVEAAYSTNGGVTWTQFSAFTNVFGDPNTTNPRVPYTRVSDASVGFDHNGQFYILVSQHNDAGTSGALVLNKFDFTGGAPVRTISDLIVKQWVPAGDQVFSPTMAIDDTLASFTDPTTGNTQTNPYAGNVYIAWATGDVQPANPNNPNPFNPNRIKLIASSDGGQTFSTETVVSDSSSFGNQDNNLGNQRNGHPRLAISQGSAGVPGGQVSVVWDDFGTLANASTPQDRVMADSVTGAKAETFVGPTGPINDNTPATPTVFSQTVNFSNANFNPDDLDVTVTLTHPAINELQIELVAPNGARITLFRNQTDAAGNTNANIGAAGANLGVLNGVGLGTTFDDDATRNIVDIFNNGRGAAAPFIGHFRPETSSLDAFLTAAKAGNPANLNGTWRLEITDFRANNVGSLNAWSLQFTDGLLDRTDSVIATTTVRGVIGDNYAASAPSTPNGIGPNIVVATDNTLGSFSPYQGRIYVAYVNRDTVTGNPADNTDIYLSYSDNAGLNWSTPTRVNQDNALVDGYSEGGVDPRAGRAQYMPNIAVDQATGTLVLTWFDARHDAARARVATYMTTSIDGGNTFGGEAFANKPLEVFDVATGTNVVLGPIPDNQSSGNPNTESTFGFGSHQGLAVYAGHIYPIWSSNENGGDNANRLDIRLSNATFSAGPRIIDGTMGPVGEGGIGPRAADGAPLARSLVVTFDRPVDPNTFTAADIQLQARDTAGNLLPAAKQPVVDAVNGIVPLDNGPLGATRFQVNFHPQDNSTDSIPGTISYVVGPNIQDRIRRVGTTITPGALNTFFSGTVNLPIPPGAPATTSGTTFSPIVVSGMPTTEGIIKVTAQVNITHTFDADLVIYLVSPAGTFVNLADTRGGSGDNYINTVFDDNAPTSIASGSAPFTGTFRPEEVLAQFNGENANGTWFLVVQDQFTQDFGTLLNWSLTIQTGTASVGVISGNAIDQDGDAITNEPLNDVFDAPQRQNPNAPFFTAPFVRDTMPLIVPGPHIVDTSMPGAVPSTDNLARNRSVNALDLTFDRDMLVSSFTPADILRIMGPAGDITKPIRFGANISSPLAIPDGGNTPLQSQIVIDHANDFTIDDLDIRLDINHPRLSDLTVTLIAPDGTRVKLVQNTSGANFSGTTLDDEAPTAVTQGTAPFSGRFRPVEPLSSLDGKSLEGVWTLEVQDSTAGGNSTGTLVGWSLTATPKVNVTVTPVFNAPITLSGSTDATETSNRPILGSSTILSNLNIDASQGVLPGEFLIGDLNVRLDLNLTAADAALNELSITLIAPDGTRIALLGPGQLSDTNVALKNTVLDDEAPGRINDTGVAPPYTGSFKSAIPLSALDGKDLSGNWQLEIVDNKGTGTRGYLRAWSLEVTPSASSTNAAARNFRVGFPTQALSGTYTVDIASDIQSQTGYSLDTNLNAGLDALRQVAAATVDKKFVSDQVPLTIGPGKTIDSTLVVGEDFVIQDVELQLNISFPNDPFLEAYLIAPDGTQIRLFKNVGANGTKTNFQDTIFDDGTGPSFLGPNGLPITLIDNGNAPFNGRFRPQQQLNQLVGRSSVNGSVSSAASPGVYTLRIVNTSDSQSGTLNSWSLTLKKAVPATGLGEPSADRDSASFRIFTMDPTNELSSSTWTAVGPAGLDNGNRSSRIGAIAIDPSDPTGNTVYTAGATGGVWKTTNFLDPNNQPTWIPLTDFGPTLGINIGSITVFGRNNDPNQSIVFATTGDGDGGTAGVGIIRSMDGGATWTLLDSTDNTLPFNGRDHALVGNTSFQVVVDPKPTTSGDVIVYAAMSGPNGGIWRSTDTGQTWSRVLIGQATDVTLDPNSGTFNAISNPTGNLQIIYAGIRGQGVFRSPNKGNSWTLLNGGVGKPLEIDGESTATPPNSVTVNNLGQNPNGPQGRIVLGKPALVPDTDPDAIRKNLMYQGWLYAAVATANGDTINLYVTKDSGLNWTRVQLPNQFVGLAPTLFGNPIVIPSNDTNNNDIRLNTQGNYNISLTVDPNNPNIVYVGSQVSPTVIRVDITGLHDPHAFYIDSSQNDGGQRQRTAPGAAQLLGGTRYDAPGGYDPRTFPTINLYRNPFDPVNGTSQYIVNSTASIQNDGSGATWTPFESALGGVDQHRMIAMVDPITGKTRLIFGYDQGIATAVDNNGQLDFGVGTARSVNGVRDGNLQINQFYYGAVQPSARDLNGQIYAALFIGSLQDNGGPRSTGDILNTGNLYWTGPGGDGGGVSVDKQGYGTVFQYFWPCCGGNGRDFFQVDGVGNTDGLFRQANGDPQWPYISGSSNNIAVNPVNSSQLLISSFTGRLYRSQDQAQFWSDIGPLDANNQPQPLDGSGLRALAYGAPLTTNPFGNTDDFIYAGSYSGNLYVTADGGRTWTNIGGTAGGLDGSSVMAIVPNPTRGSHEAYAVTSRGVYHIADSLAPGARWTNITSNLFGITHDIFGDPDFVETRLKGLNALAVDWRYSLPDVIPSNPNALLDFYRTPLDQLTSNASNTHPVLYVGGNGGVFRSTDDGSSWQPFPSAEPNSLSTTPTPPADGGGFPYSNVTDLQLSLGKIDPTTGFPIAAPGDPNILTAFTFGRGVFAIRMAPQVRADLIMLDPLSPVGPSDPNYQGGSDSGLNDGTPYNPPSVYGPAAFRDKVTNQLNAYIAGYGEQSANGNKVYITLYDMSDPVNPRYIGGYKPGESLVNGASLSLGQTDKNGRFVHVDPLTGLLMPGVQVLAGLDPNIQRLPDGIVHLGVQATDQSGTSGNIALFDYTLDTTPPNAPNFLGLDPNDDNIAPNNDGITSQTTNLHFLATGLEKGSKLELYRDDGTGPVLVNSLFVPANTTSSSVISIVDPGPLNQATYLYTVRSIDVAGNPGSFSNAVQVIIPIPGALSQPTLLPADDSGISSTDNYTAVNANLRFTATGITPGATLQLVRGFTVVKTLTNVAGGTVEIADPGPIPDGTYSYSVRQIVNSQTTLGNSTIITIDTTSPVAPNAPKLQAVDDTGSSNSDGVTAVSINLHFNVGGIESNGRNGKVLLFRDGVQVAEATGTSGGTVVLTDPGIFNPATGQYEALPNGTYLYTAQQIDRAGNTSTVSTATTIVINALPLLPAPTLDASSDSGVFNNDNITNKTTLVFNLTGIPAGAAVQLLRNGAVVPGGTRIGNGAVTDNGPVPEGVHQYTVRVVDTTGAIGFSAPLTVTVDLTAPLQPQSPQLDPNDDTGLSYLPGTLSDRITRINKPHLIGNTTDPNGFVVLTDASGLTVLGQVNSPFGPGGSYSVQPVNALPDGTYTFRVRAADLAGNLSIPSNASLPITIITKQPTPAPTLSLVRADDTGISNLDNITNIDRPRFLGTAPTSANPATPNRVELLDANGTILAVTSVAPDGTFGYLQPFTPTNSLPEGDNFLQVRVVDVAGNSNISAVLKVTVDKTAPTTVPTLALDSRDDTGKVGDNVTANRRPRFIGSYDATIDGPRQTIELVDAANPSVTLATITAATNGSYSLQLPSNLSNGKIVLQARVVDPAGNRGPLSAPLQIRINSLKDDYDNDGKSDPAVYRSSNSLWSILQSTAGKKTVTYAGGGSVNDVPLLGDLDNDGKADNIIFRANTAQFLAKRTTLGTMPTMTIPGSIAGVAIPALADYDGDSVTDLAVFQQSSGTGQVGQWLILQSGSGQLRTVNFGTVASASDKLIPVAGDYDGDRKIDLAVYHSSTGVWDILQSSTGTVVSIASLGGAGVAAPVPGDYDGDSKIDAAVWNPQTATWSVLNSSTGQQVNTKLSTWKANDVAVPGDYDGDGLTDRAVYRPSTGQYIFNLSGGGTMTNKTPGAANDYPLQATYAWLRSRGQSQLLPLAPKTTATGGTRTTTTRTTTVTPTTATPRPTVVTRPTTTTTTGRTTTTTVRSTVVNTGTTTSSSTQTPSYLTLWRNRLLALAQQRGN